MKKKIVASLVATVIALTMAACGQKPADASAEPSSEAVESTVESTEESAVEPTVESAEPTEEPTQESIEPQETAEPSDESGSEPAEAETEASAESEAATEGTLIELGTDDNGNTVTLDTSRELMGPMPILFMDTTGDWIGNITIGYSDDEIYTVNFTDYDKFLDVLEAMDKAGFTNYAINTNISHEGAVDKLNADLADRGAKAIFE